MPSALSPTPKQRRRSPRNPFRLTPRPDSGILACPSFHTAALAVSSVFFRRHSILRKQLLFLFAVLPFLFQGCGPSTVNRAAIGSMKKVALVNVTLDKVGQGAENDLIQQQAVDYAARRYVEQFGALPQWQLVQGPALAELDREFSDLASSKILLIAFEDPLRRPDTARPGAGNAA